MDLAEGQGVLRARGRPKTTSDDARRTTILAEARAIFHDLGYGGTTMDLVAARCQVSKQTLYKLFSSKVDLFLAVIEAHRSKMLQLPRDPGEDLPLAETLEDIFLIDIDEEDERDREALIHMIVSEVQQYPEIGVMLHRHGVQQSRQLLADWLSQQQRRGRLHVEDPMGGARMLMDMIFGAMASFPNCPDDWPDRQSRRRHLRMCIDVFLNGVCRAGRQRRI